MPMQQDERAASFTCILGVESVDELDGVCYQRMSVLILRAGDGIRKISQEPKMKVRILIGEISRLQFLEKFIDLLLVKQQRRYDDHGRRVLRNPFGEIQLGERLSLDERRNGIVDKIHASLCCRQKSEQ